MNLRLIALISVAGFAMFGSLPSAEAGVKGNTYTVYGLTASYLFISDTYEFGTDNSLTTDADTGTFIDFDFVFIDSWSALLTADANPHFTLNLSGIQISSYILAQGVDSNGTAYYLIGSMSETTSQTTAATP